jgi:hypothetical protein
MMRQNCVDSSGSGQGPVTDIVIKVNKIQSA